MSVIAVNSDAPVSVKCRIGVDDHDSYDELCKILLLISLSIRVRDTNMEIGTLLIFISYS